MRLLTTIAALLSVLPCAAADETVAAVEREGVRYQVVRCQPAQVRVFWKKADGEKLSTIQRAAAHLRASGEKPIAIMNGGIFEPGHVPSGLLVQGGKALTPLNLRDGKGNFFLKPNGVFWVAGGRAGVTDAAAFDPAMPGLSDAVQSGPLLLKGGKTHPVFKKDSKWRLHRNGVGVTPGGEVVFAITEFRQDKFPTLFEFADLFRSLGCRDALFLDGDLSQLRTEKDFDRTGNLFASMIAVLEEGDE